MASGVASELHEPPKSQPSIVQVCKTDFLHQFPIWSFKWQDQPFCHIPQSKFLCNRKTFTTHNGVMGRNLCTSCGKASQAPSRYLLSSHFLFSPGLPWPHLPSGCVIICLRVLTRLGLRCLLDCPCSLPVPPPYGSEQLGFLDLFLLESPPSS